VQLRSDRLAFVDVDVAEGERNFRAHIVQARDLEPGAYDFIVRRLRYGYAVGRRHALPCCVRGRVGHRASRGWEARGIGEIGQ
jgi:hypothetical protein